MARRRRNAEPETRSNEVPQGMFELIRGMTVAMQEQAAALQEQVAAAALQEQVAAAALQEQVAAAALQEQVVAALQEQAAAMREQVAATAQFVRQAREEGSNNNINQEKAEGNSDYKGWKDFRRSSPPSFEGEYDPKKAMRWLKEIEKLFVVFDNTDAQKVSYGTYMLKGDAGCWWRGAKRLMEARGTAVTWDSFKDAFLERYFPRIVREQKEMDFLSIKQGDAPFEKFLAEYEDLAEYSSHMKANPDERWKCVHFVNALNPKLNDRVAPLEITNFATLVNKCRLINAGMPRLEKGTQQSDSHKRKQPMYVKGGEYKNDKGKKPKTAPSTGTACPKCGRFHGNRPCLAGQGLCFKCGKPGHIARNCPQVQKLPETPRPPTHGRVYTLKGKEVAQSDDLIKGSGGATGITGITVDKSVEFSYEELATATNNFSMANKIGQGGFGAVYCAELRGEKAAIKKMDMQATREFLAELKVLTNVHHLNLVRLIGYCVENCLFLVYEYIENGNLSQHLRGSGGRDPLPWSSRVQIALDSARGLEYIHEHTVPVYIHRDIKSANILIDRSFHGKVADFGLAKLTEAGSSTLPTGHLVGTFGYMPPEYAQYGYVSPKVDVYAFGVVLYELISAKEAIVKTSQSQADSKGLVAMFDAAFNHPDPTEDLCKLVDPRLGDDYPADSVYKMAQLAKACTQENPQLRPTMRSIVVALMALSSTTVDWDAGSFYENPALLNLMSGR